MTGNRELDPNEGAVSQSETLSEEGRRRELIASNSLLTSVLESPDKIVIFSLDRDYRYTAFNANHQRTMKQIWGANIEIGMNMLDLIGSSDDRAKAQKNFDRVLKGERFTKIERYGEPPNRFFYEDVYNPILDDARQVIGLTLFLTDITARVKAEEQLMRHQNHLEEIVEERTVELRAAYERLEEETRERRKTEALLQRIQRLEALGTLAGGVAHDFNNLLTAIVGYSGLLREDLGNPELCREHLGFLLEACDQGTHLTSRLLAFSRRQILQPTATDLAEVVESVVRLLGRLLPENIVLTTSHDASLPPVSGDPGQLEQVIMNLVLNARDALSGGGRIRIRTLYASETGEHRYQGENDQACLEVEDDGKGIDSESFEKIFDPFFTTKDTGKGSGLGLSVVYGIVEQHAGEILVDSQPGEGSVFRVVLPFEHDRTHIDQPVVDGQADQGDLCAGATILLVEDEASIRKVTSQILERNGFQVTSASSFGEALRAFEEEDGQFDLLFSDIVLTGRNGIELARELIARRPGLPILMTSGYSGEETEPERVFELPHSSFLAKPYGTDELIDSIRRLISTP